MYRKPASKNQSWFLEIVTEILGWGDGGNRQKSDQLPLLHVFKTSERRIKGGG